MPEALALATVTVETFRDAVGDSFRLDVPDAGVAEVRLTSADSLGAGSGGGRAPFSLEFVAAPELSVEQRIYRLEHDRLGALEVFLVPLGPGPDGMRLEAIFT